MEIILLLISLTLPTFLGLQILRIFFHKSDFFLIEKLFLSYGLGMGCVTLGMFYMSLLTVGFNIPLLLCFFSGLLVFGQKFKAKIAESAKQSQSDTVTSHQNIRMRFLTTMIFLFIVLNIAVVFLRTMVIDIDMWDSWAFWAFKAKIFYFHNTVPFVMFQKFQTVWGNWDYPLHVPLMETWILLWVGHWNDIFPRIIFPLFYTGICVNGFCFLGRYLNLISSLLGTCLLASFPILQVYTIGTIAEPVLLFYYVSSLVLLYRWLEEGQERFLVLSAIMAGLALWTKSEGLVLVTGNILLITFSLLKDHKFKTTWGQAARCVVIIAMIIVPWNIYKMVNNIHNVAFNSNYFQTERLNIYLSRIIKVPQVFLHHFINFPSWNILWLLTGIAFILNIKFFAKRIPGFLLFSILFQFTIYAFGYITIPWAEEIFVYDTMARLMMAPAVLAILYSSLILLKV